MAVLAAVMTGRGAGAIATIQLFGDSVEAVLRALFRPANGRLLEFAAGRILLGELVDGEEPIDQVTIGCEGPHTFCVHCHGNPLLVERIMSLLRRTGVQPVQAEQLLGRTLSNRQDHSAIEIEAKLALATVKTVEGATIVANQVKAGLTGRARKWQVDFEALSLEQIASDARQILRGSDAARLILFGCTIVLLGPPNTGKSTLLNALAGREKAIVTDVKGTTRDWVSADIHIPPLAATIVDTAGLEPALAAGDIDQAAQRKSTETLERADLVLLVLDRSHPADPPSGTVAERLAGHRTVTVLNKADLPNRFDPAILPEHLRHVVHASARSGTGIEDLIAAMHRACGVGDFSLEAAVVFTARQRALMDRLTATDSRDEAAALIAELLSGPVAV